MATILRPEPMDHVSPLLDREEAGTKHVRWSGIANEQTGVESTDATHPRLYSDKYDSCTGLLLQNMDTGVTSLFHFFPATIIRGHVEALEEMRAKGGHYRGVFITGNYSNPADQPQDMLAHGRDRGQYSLEEYVNEALPGIQWHEPIAFNHDTWSLGYDNLTRTMHIEDHDSKNQRWGQSVYYDYGDPFALTPVRQIEQTGATLLPPAKRSLEREE